MARSTSRLPDSSTARRSVLSPRRIQLDRAYQRDSLLSRLVEERIVARELIELELQEADEQIEQISKGAGDSLMF